MEERTWSVGELLGGLRALLDEALPGSVWVEGEIRGCTRSRPGHVYFDLVDPDADPRRPDAKLPVALFRSDRERVEATLAAAEAPELADGLHVRVQGRVSLYAARAQVQLVARAVDPAFTLGRLEAERRRVLAALAAEGLLERQQRLVVPTMARRVALVTSAASAAAADALDELRSSGLGWDVVLVDTAVQGTDAPERIAAAIARGAAEAPLVLLVRGGGSRGDLAAFDAEVVARAVATAPVPVWTGIGHEIDRTIADEAAHTAHKTPTACAAALAEHVRAGLARAEQAWLGIERAAGRRVGTASTDLAARAHRLDRAVALRLRSEHRHLEAVATGLPDRARRRLGAHAEHLAVASVRIDAADPVRQLARGWSITTTADGRTVRSVRDLAPGAELRTRVADGAVASTITSTTQEVDADAR